MTSEIVNSNPLSIEKIIHGDRRSLAKAITLIESSRKSDEELSLNLLEQALPHSGRSFRIGISGIPGAGKSSFIESMGMHLTSKGFKIAVLVIDPSSPVSGGAVLGDKVRMPQLSQNPNAFIRPTSSQGVLGGVAQKTRESIILCEAAGFDITFVETVGVGQSEYEVSNIVDLFMVLLSPLGGDEIQGIKKGILELAHILIINKADGTNLNEALIAFEHYSQALQFFKESGNWKTQIAMCSAIENKNIDTIAKLIFSFKELAQKNGSFEIRRKQQNQQWFEKLFLELLHQRINLNPIVKKKLEQLRKELFVGSILPITAAKRCLDEVFEARDVFAKK